VIEMCDELGDIQTAHPGCGQLDRQRQPIQPPAQRRHGGAEGVGEYEIRRGHARAVNEQAHRIVRREARSVGRLIVRHG
jgi:hypothetical protein